MTEFKSIKNLCEYEKIKELLISLGYTKIQEDILINGDLIHNFFNPINKEGINLSFEKY